MSTIPKTKFGEISFRATFESLGLTAWGVGSVPQDAASRMEKDENLQGIIRSTRCAYARQLKTAWDAKYWDRESNKTSRRKQLAAVLDFHEFRMIHGR